MFSLNTNNVVPLDFTYVLRLRQRNASNFVLYHAETAAPTDYLPDADELRNVTSLSFRLGSKLDSQRAASVLEQAHAVTSLSLHVMEAPHGRASESRNVCPSYLDTVLRRWLTSDKGEKLALKRLVLENFHLTGCGSKVARAIAPNALRDLTFLGCWDIR
ncbi:hypothetical protein LTR53_008493 [Teratosphaeriaceae sp. CCFEE 6253]|nr:hypothetical protein LTR53_008493 [Teratosphaeriaceae sp. CCFEE 6253]